MSLNVEHINKSYKSGWIKDEKIFSLNDVSFTLEKGKILALIGQNGAGKTTLIKCMLNLLHPDSGTILSGGNTIEQMIEKGSLGFMPDSLKFPDMITLKEYITDLMVLRGKRFSDYEEDFYQLADKLYMTKHLDKLITQYSKGTMKKAAFIQAVIHRPELLILDEPTDGLDPVSRRILLKELLNMKENGSTIVIATHLLSDISMIADEVVVLQNGYVIKKSNRTDIKCSLDDWYLQTILENGGMEDL